MHCQKFVQIRFDPTIAAQGACLEYMHNSNKSMQSQHDRFWKLL
ncbi:hypothetical protein Poly24_43020 [Rosistilla carotiformis]|uniref:Uncharacterized protein n=1 Tax=Rosistilla carotiformis TaxID=2528017 RepID=A0A518JYF7_9BACT|nr:hypothetical protein Poly24_43020 [Rosistilla carotiformis]